MMVSIGRKAREGGFARTAAAFFAGALILTCVGCSSLASSLLGETKEEYVVCPYDTVWDTALETMKTHPVTVKNKSEGRIETAWVEGAAQGQPYGLLKREGMGDKERARLIMIVNQLDDVTKVSLSENREHWGFVGGGRLYSWKAVPASQDALNGIMNRLKSNLEGHGCVLSS